jgi:hypothetical protein
MPTDPGSAPSSAASPDREGAAQGERPAEVFVSYASKDRSKVLALADQLERAGISVWRDQARVLGGENYGPKIVRAIKDAKVLLLCCSDASMRSKNVKQEIQLAWHYNVPYFPVLLEDVSYPEQVEYWLQGWQYVPLHDGDLEQAMPRILDGLRAAGVGVGASVVGDRPPPHAAHPVGNLDALWKLARFTDQMWPVVAEPGPARATLRDLGAPQEELQRGFALGERVRIALESDRDAYLLLLDKGTSGKVYCLCPSAFAPEQAIGTGVTYLPQEVSRHRAFAVTGSPGREHLLAILSSEPLCAEWWPATDARIPARQLSEQDIADLLARLRDLAPDQWTALSTYFEITPRLAG